MKQIRSAFLPLISSLLITGVGNCSAESAIEARLSDTEIKWLHAAEPVLDFAQSQGLVIDIVVQPKNKSGDVPLAMGVRDGHCKLVLSMRGNPEAEATLRDIPLNRQTVLIEAMTAHEIAHCWRYTQGVWNVLPAGFTETRDAHDTKEMAEQKQKMHATRREEGYADLVGLAWTLQQHPDQYTQVHAWLEHIRHDQPVAGSYHDTRVWLNLTKEKKALELIGTPFDKVQTVWAEGLRIQD